MNAICFFVPQPRLTPHPNHHQPTPRHSVRPLAQLKGASSAETQTSTKRRTLPVKQDLHLAPDCYEKNTTFAPSNNRV